MAMRNTPCQSTGYSPHYLLFGKEMHLPSDTSLLPKPSLGKDAKMHITTLIDNLKVVKAIAKDNMATSQTVNKDRQDLKSQQPTFSIGDQVLLFKQDKMIGHSPKLTQKWDGPYFIMQIGPNHTYKLCHSASKKTHTSLVHANRLKHFDARMPSTPQESTQTRHSQETQMSQPTAQQQNE
ncbi:uncharacterized protein LOC121381454 [Gigantopelta aegis]|uniref:uncharacterized protein LOC121381454 n=1 Tax=Gigantopelta aegis TaxID=1735272 RepID=UPI001B88CADA|nr:uncharacterized protein LOC121381454 [Gigantopelta aegis]